MSKSQATRRDFLKSSTATALAGVAVTQLAVSKFAHAAGDDVVKVGLIGCGGRGTGAATQALSTEGGVKLVSMGDAFSDRLEGALGRIQNEMKNQGKADRVDVPAERRFTGFDAYKQVIASGVDLILLATPPGFRPVHFEAAVEAGKHVFMEKPVAVDGPGVRTVLKANEKAKKLGLKVGVGLQRHHQLGYLETIQRLQDGAIGDIHTMRAYWNGAGVWVKEREANQSEMEYQMRNWYYFNWLCGDHICEQHIHNLDVCNWLKNAFPASCNGMGGRQVRTDKKYGEIYDHHFLEYIYEDGSRMFSQCRHIPNCWNSVTEHCQGSKGTADISGHRIESSGEKWRFQGKSANPYQVEHDDLFAAIRSGAAYNEGDYGAKSSLTAIMGRMATYSGKVVTWEQALNSEINLAPERYAFDATPPVLPDENGRYTIAMPGITKAV